MKKKNVVSLIAGSVVLIAVALCAIFIKNLDSESGRYYMTFVSLLPPIIAITLALITKEVYSSLFIGIFAGALFYAEFRPVKLIDTIINDGLLSKLADEWDMGILIFLVLLGIMVALVNRAGGSAAFGNWAQKNIKTRTGAQLATFILGVLIFVDDYFNCLTVGSVMLPLTDSHKISRSKLAYLIDATAAPICMIAPISSWAAAVSGVVEGDESGLSLFCSAIPYNFYSLLTIVMILCLIFMKFDYGPMKRHEKNAANGDLFTEGERNFTDVKYEFTGKSSLLDLVLPIALLIVCCICGMLYNGGFFSGTSFIDAFAGCDASIGLPWGSLIALVITIIYLLARRVISFKHAMDVFRRASARWFPRFSSLPRVDARKYDKPARPDVTFLLWKTQATDLKLLPAIIFLVALGLAFATDTSWGTFTILIPIIQHIFTPGTEIFIIGISACLAGAVCGDHCSPISDTTIMASAGAECNHINHVSTQLPYALTVAGVSFFAYLLCAFIQNWLVVLPISVAVLIGLLFLIRFLSRRADALAPTVERADG